MKEHIVQLDENVLNSYRYLDDKPQIFYANCKNHRFTGYLVNTTGSALYFEPKDPDGLIIVPHAWIRWCLPIGEAKEDAHEKV